MKKPAFWWGCLLVGVFALLLLAAAGGWWYLRTRNRTTSKEAPPALSVFLLAPANGSEATAGDILQAEAQTIAPVPVQSVELFVDGEPVSSAESAEDPAWTWRALPAGIHTMFARATAGGETGQSPTIILNVLPSEDPLQVTAGEGDTLEQVGAGFGIPPDQMIAANPHLSPGVPLADGQPVQVPSPDTNPPDDGGNASPANNTPELPLLKVPAITWKFTPSGPVDKSYCYTSTGGGIWQKMPTDAFEFFGGGPTSYMQTGIPMAGDQVILQAQCWGWLGGVLKFLGQGETGLKLQDGSQEVMISAEGFSLVGTPKLPPVPTLGGGGVIVPPPFALREPADAADCSAHSHPLLAPFICKTLLSQPVKQYTFLEWEWQPKTCWGGDCGYAGEIAGYRVYALDPITSSKVLLKEVTNPAQKIVALPLPWGPAPPCYSVTAYVDNPAVADSVAASYCPGLYQSQPQKVTLTPTDWITTGGNWIDQNCEEFGALDPYIDVNQTSGFGNNTGEVFVGSDLLDSGDCFQQADYSGAVKFAQPGLPPGVVIQNAVLRFTKAFSDYGADGWSSNAAPFCASGLSRALQSWTGQVTANHFVGTNFLMTKSYNSPITSIPEAGNSYQVDVSATVKNWMKHPETNHGFILNPDAAPEPSGDGYGRCFSGVSNFQLDIYYFAP
jgi:LysM repeat protein